LPREALVHDPIPVLPEYYASAAEKQRFVRQLFDATARDYDRVQHVLDLGSGSWYRREALRRAGLAPGMRMLDVAVGTGLVAKEALGIIGDSGSVTGVDPSAGMMAGVVAEKLALVRGRAEALPFAAHTFDFVALGYALRHLADLEQVSREFYRVLKPGGRLLVLEITRPAGRLARTLLRTYLRGVGPLVSRIVGSGRHAPTLYRYYWDTIEACAPAERVVATIAAAGFTRISKRSQLGFLSEYYATA
jgi:demethylmenaquinone methyltransferase / 2-methoxy-6-polyprenyl-1,4-benzoquinol methylase